MTITIIKNLWRNKKLVGFTILNAGLFALINAVKFGIQTANIWLLGYFLIERFLGLPYVSLWHSFAYAIILKIAVIIYSQKSKA